MTYWYGMNENGEWVQYDRYPFWKNYNNKKIAWYGLSHVGKEVIVDSKLAVYKWLMSYYNKDWKKTLIKEN